MISPVTLHTPSSLSSPPPSTELALIQILSEYHQAVDTITRSQMQGLKDTSLELDTVSKQFLADIAKLYETQKNASVATPILQALEYATSLMSITIGTGLCATGVAAIVGTIMITTGVCGCIHTTFVITDTYAKLAQLTENKEAQAIIAQYLPAMIYVCLKLSLTLTTSYSHIALQQGLDKTLALFVPYIIQALETSQVVTRGIFDFHIKKKEAIKISHQALSKCLQQILEERQEALKENFSSQVKLHKNGLETLRLLATLYQQI